MDLRTKLEEHVDRIRIIYTFLLINYIGSGYLIYLTWGSKITAIIFVLPVLFTLISIWMLLDIRRHTTDSQSGENYYDNTDRHYLCADPLCERCKGYYAGLTFTTTSVMTLYAWFLERINRYNINPVYIIVAGTILFILCTPLQGVLKSSTRVLFEKVGIEEQLAHPNFFSFSMGFLSGVGVGLSSIGILSLSP